jgi:predicted dehydrogenase
MQRHHNTTRRQFLKSAAALGAGVYIASHSESARAVSANDRLAIGVIGVAHRGRSNIEDLLKVKSARIVALCDVSEKNLADMTGELLPDAAVYTDFRKMLEAEKHLDAVLTATADHTHAPATLMALNLGRHVYCEKPLAHNVFEARRVTETAAKMKKVSQLGTQIHAGDNYRRVVELIKAGAIGKVTEVHVFVNKTWGATRDRASIQPSPVPKDLHYDTWLGPAEEWPYSGEWLPATWRRWWNFGNGTLGDMGCHYMDLPFWALDLKYPTKISAEGPPVDKFGCPQWIKVHYEFPAGEGGSPPLKLHWYDGGKKPDQFDDWNLDKKKWDSGVFFLGEKGQLVAGYNHHQLLPEKNFAGFQPPAQSIPRSIGHHAEWVEACRANDTTKTTCNFAYSGPLSEAVLLGTVAYRTGKAIDWDAANLKVTNAPDADQYIKRVYRKGWEIA